MKVKIFDKEHEEDLEDSINDFIYNKDIIDIKYTVAIMYDGREQIFCYTAMILYN